MEASGRVVAFDPDVVAEQIRRVLGQLDELPTVAAVGPYTGTRSVEGSERFNSSLAGAADGLRARLGDALEILETHSGNLKAMAEAMTWADADAQKVVRALSEALDQAATRTDAIVVSNPGVGSTEQGRAAKTGGF